MAEVDAWMRCFCEVRRSQTFRWLMPDERHRPLGYAV